VGVTAGDVAVGGVGVSSQAITDSKILIASIRIMCFDTVLFAAKSRLNSCQPFRDILGVNYLLNGVRQRRH